jgi:glycosyltransferase involved in cell wall biosynthesis
VSRIRILYFISSLRPGGAQTGLRRIAKSLDPEEYSLTIVTINAGIEDPSCWAPEWCEVVDLQIRDLSKLYLNHHLWRMLRSTDVLVCSLYEASLIGRFVGLLNPSVRIVDWRHNTSFQNRRRRLLFNLTAWIPDVVLADSRAVADVLEDEPGMFATPIRHVPIAGVDTDEFAPPEERPSGPPYTVASVMRLTEQKNPWAIIELAERFQDSPEVRFEVAGDGPLLDDIRARVDEAGLDNVEFHGFVEDLPAFLGRAHIYLQPSLSEGLCITVPEAMACELPVVASRVGGIPETVIHDETGYLLNPNNICEFETYLRELINNAHKRREWGESGRTRIKRHYSADVLTSELLCILNRSA